MDIEIGTDTAVVRLSALEAAYLSIVLREGISATIASGDKFLLSGINSPADGMYAAAAQAEAFIAGVDDFISPDDDDDDDDWGE